MKRTLRAILFRYMLAVIVITGGIRLTLWLAYQAIEANRGHVVFHEQISEMLILLFVEVVALGVLGFMLWRLSRILLSPLRSVANAAEGIARGQLDKRIRTQHLPEGELLGIANALNASFDRYQEAIDRISRFSSAAAHQLRTPLTTIRTTAELSLTQPGEKAAHEEALASILEDTQHLCRMTEQLLLLSRMDAEHLRKDFKTVDLNTVIRRATEVYELVLEQKHVRLDTRLSNGCPLLGDEALLTEAVMNLLDNAAMWSPDHGVIVLSTRRAGSDAILEVSDAGPGIDEEMRKQLFERFERHPAAPYQGTGLGLSIVQEVVRLHDGTIDVDASEEGGARFRIVLPGMP